jgi:membrane AbrB-like protein
MSLAGRSLTTQWILLLVLSVAFAAGLEALGLPAALLLGPMVAGALLGTNDATAQVPRLPYMLAQAIISCLMVRGITSSIFDVMLHDGLLFIVLIAAVLLASGMLGWILMRMQVFPGTTAIWACWPGAASAMVLMAEDYGADARLVAFMQYLRVVLVALTASIVARFWVDPAVVHAAGIVWFPEVRWLPFAETVALVLTGVLLGQVLRIPAGGFIVTLVLGIVLHVSELIEIELPQWLLTVSYALVGWRIGLLFTGPILRHAFRALPRVLASIITLILICSGFAWLLTRYGGIDPLTAFLATSPGGADAIAIISASTAHVDVQFVMAMQTLRFFVVLLIGPALARLFAGAGRPKATPPAPPASPPD